MAETLVVKSEFKRFEVWEEAFARSDLKLMPWGSVKAKGDIDYALVWKPEPGALAAFPNLKIIFSIGAGLDHLMGENIVPSGVPVVRMVEEGLTAGMIEYVLFHVLRYHRFMDRYESHKDQRRWEPIQQIPAHQRSVGILGLGELGRTCATSLVHLGFNAMGWSRGEKNLPGVSCFYGVQQLNEMLRQSEILVCLLPLTEHTAGILNCDTFAQMPKGSFIVNAGRGGHQVEADILEALDSGQLAGAALDVFETEPLPPDHPIWRHPKVYFTPHVASMTLPATSSVHVYHNIQRYREGKPLTHIADLDRGY